MCRCSCVQVSGTAAVAGCVVVEWVHRWACLFWCAGFLLLSISQALGGTQEAHMTGPCKAELVTPIVPQQIHPFGVLLSLHCQPTPQHSSRHGDEPDVPSPYSLAALDPSHFRASDCRAGAHVATRAKWTFLHSFLSKALCWHNNLPPTSTYYVWIFNIYMTMLWFIGSVMLVQGCEVYALTCKRWRTLTLAC